MKVRTRIKRIIKSTIKNWLSDGKKEDHSQILKKEGRISHLEKKVIRQGKAIRELQARTNRLGALIQKLRAEIPRKH